MVVTLVPAVPQMTDLQAAVLSAESTRQDRASEAASRVVRNPAPVLAPHVPPDSLSRGQRKCNEQRHNAASGKREKGQRRKRGRRREGPEMTADEALKLRASRQRLQEKSRLYDQLGA